MKPLFTIHGGEYLVGSYVEEHFRRVNVWGPSKDTGVDLLVSERHNRRSVPSPRLVIGRARDVRYLIRFLGAEVVSKFFTTKAVSKALFDLRQHAAIPFVPLPGKPLINVLLALL